MPDQQPYKETNPFTGLVQHIHALTFCVKGATCVTGVDKRRLICLTNVQNVTALAKSQLTEMCLMVFALNAMALASKSASLLLNLKDGFASTTVSGCLLSQHVARQRRSARL